MKVGDKVYYTEPRNEILISEGAVTKIGRKYFYVSRYKNDRNPFKVDKETMRDKTCYGYSYSCQVYLSKQEILDEREFNSLWKSLQILFSARANKKKISLEVLREVARLLRTDGENE